MADEIKSETEVVKLIPKEVLEYRMLLLEKEQERNHIEHERFLTAITDLKVIPTNIAEMKTSIDRIEQKFAQYQQAIETKESMQAQLDVQKQAMAISRSGEVRQTVTTVLSLAIATASLLFSLIFFLVTKH